MRAVAFLVFASLMSMDAAAVEPYRYPEQTDRDGWLAFCEGMEKEVARQATMADNRTLYEHSGSSARALIGETLVRYKQAKVVFPETSYAYWESRGVGLAGNPLWDSAPASDAKEGTGAHLRNLIIATRSPMLQGCDGMAAQAAAYQEQADIIAKEMNKQERARLKAAPKSQPGALR